jgi:hypothetical protein
MTVPASASAPTTLDSIRRSLGDRYGLERELGRGGMGTVYLARDLKLDRPVALKVLLPEFATQAGLRDRFLRETRTAASFSHPNIVPVYAVEDGEDYLAYAMGFVEGETLTQRVERAGPLPVRELVRIVQDAGYALAYAHGRGVVHRDIKPDNVMLERATGRALVLDFGISRSMAHMPAATATNLTRVGEVVGTPEYMSPEQASGDVVDGRSDLYALGLTAYYAATGRTAVTAENTQKVLVRQLTERLASISTLRPDLPPALAAAIDRCVEKDPDARFSTAEALVEEIDAAQLAEPEIPLPIRLFADDLASLSLSAIFLLVFAWQLAALQAQRDMSELDVMIPVVGLLAIIFARVLTTMSEGRRLAEAGYSVNDVRDGIQRVTAERVTRRAELRADPRVRARRRRTIWSGLAMLVGAVLMIWLSLSMRTRVGPTKFGSPPGGVLLGFSGIALFGMGFVLLAKSPFRMSPPERLFRIVWLGPIGRAFVRLSMRGAQTGAGPVRRGQVSQARGAAVAPVVAAPAPRSVPAALSSLASLEARVDALERWRRAGGGS